MSDENQSIICQSFLVKYSRNKKEPRVRWVILAQSKLTNIKTIYTFKTQEDSIGLNGKKATERIEIGKESKPRTSFDFKTRNNSINTNKNKNTNTNINININTEPVRYYYAR